MGMCLIIWDKMFGTFATELPEDPPRYGLTKSIPNRGPLNIVFHEWCDMLRDFRASSLPFPQCLGHLLRDHGWKPNVTQKQR